MSDYREVVLWVVSLAASGWFCYRVGYALGGRDEVRRQLKDHDG